MTISVEAVARICHEANKAYCLGIDDRSQVSWEVAPKWQQDSAIKGVEFNYLNPDSTPEDSHKSWLAVKEADGWAYAELKDPVAKTHPCFVPYDKLPEDQRLKDHIFKAIVDTLRPYIAW